MEEFSQAAGPWLEKLVLADFACRHGYSSFREYAGDKFRELGLTLE